MATPAQLDEKLRAEAERSYRIQAATPAQMAEKGGRSQAAADSHTVVGVDGTAGSDPAVQQGFATEEQLAEKAGLEQPGASSLQSYANSDQLAEKARGRAPALPPRITTSPAPPAYTADDARRSALISQQWRSRDPRSSSTHSLVPSGSGEEGGRRTLLMIWIHGFMGSELSFQSFPAHVHNLLTISLYETHLVHTKLYPRYKSRKDISFARDDFSKWLEPHENTSTDIVLLGHSMGGLLSAEVVLQKPSSPASNKPLRHRILGTINYDTPFLGMHPGVVVSGLGSLFRPADPPPGSRPSQSSDARTPLGNSSAASSSYTLSTTTTGITSQDSTSIISPVESPKPDDPNFDPPFPNDVRIPDRSVWSGLFNFVTKHSDGLTMATKQYFMSHLEFGGCMADYPGLKNRYERIRALEDVKDRTVNSGPGSQIIARRVRFVNYYTASTGRPKKPKVPEGFKIDTEGRIKPVDEETQGSNLEAVNSQSPATAPTTTTEQAQSPAPASEDADSNVATSAAKTQMTTLGEDSGVHDEIQEPAEMRHIDSMPMDDDEHVEEPAVPEVTTEEPGDEETRLEITPSEPALPPIPAEPTEPVPVDLDLYTDKDSRKIAEKENKRILKVYQQAVKDRESAIKDRQKLIDKREKKRQQEREQSLKAQEKQRLKEEKEREKQRQKEEKEKEKQRLREEKEEEIRKLTINPEPVQDGQGSVESDAVSVVKSEKPKKDRKFCMLPPEYAGKRDKCWIRVYMEGVDEVGAHCGLFFQGPQYESLVGDVGARVEKWILESAEARGASNAGSRQ